MESFSITRMIRDYMRHKGITQKKLAELINDTPSNFNQKLLKNDMDMNLVREISIALKHDFFLEASKTLPLETRGRGNVNQPSEIETALHNFIEKNYPRVKK